MGSSMSSSGGKSSYSSGRTSSPSGKSSYGGGSGKSSYSNSGYQGPTGQNSHRVSSTPSSHSSSYNSYPTQSIKKATQTSGLQTMVNEYLELMEKKASKALEIEKLEKQIAAIEKKITSHPDYASVASIFKSKIKPTLNKD